MPSPAVPLHQAAETVAGTVTTMANRGLTQARFTLTPASLGQVRVVLTQTSNGLSARVVADHADAAQTLMQSAGELKSRLEANGTTLVRLDIGTSDQQTAGSPGGRSQDPGTQPGASNGHADGDAADDDVADATQHLTVTLGDGTLVNVLA